MALATYMVICNKVSGQSSIVVCSRPTSKLFWYAATFVSWNGILRWGVSAYAPKVVVGCQDSGYVETQTRCL